MERDKWNASAMRWGSVNAVLGESLSIAERTERACVQADGIWEVKWMDSRITATRRHVLACVVETSQLRGFFVEGNIHLSQHPLFLGWH